MIMEQLREAKEQKYHSCGRVIDRRLFAENGRFLMRGLPTKGTQRR